MCSLNVTWWIIIFYSESNGILRNFIWALLTVHFFMNRIFLWKKYALYKLVRKYRHFLWKKYENMNFVCKNFTRFACSQYFFCSLVIRLGCIFNILNFQNRKNITPLMEIFLARYSWKGSRWKLPNISPPVKSPRSKT